MRGLVVGTIWATPLRDKVLCLVVAISDTILSAGRKISFNTKISDFIEVGKVT
ncbi:hypothetical protein HRTV-25_gp1 [Halorubrum tailed virus 25]|uniref:Uncharacterized protein n=1 Tax=Halorubrum tailed virus 25 TaxID=2878006 RepID=A0AAE8XYN9_9CAUD|nr:hypothetical protein M1M37_gp001 [Halorubrum tailed virus 25]UBF22582.1 hypothetical protein HRTV-25_gp1 [Halorubrum tailed virus 25]